MASRRKARMPQSDRPRDVLFRKAREGGYTLGSIGDYEQLAGINLQSEQERRALWWKFQSMFHGETQTLFDAVVDHCAAIALIEIEQGRLCLMRRQNSDRA